MNYMDFLNEAQLDAVRATEGSVRVVAGAGTGKTRALTARYCYLADLLGVDTTAILCLTFTNKAAAEMKGRIRKYLGDFDLAYICTFHSWCVRMLKEDIHVLSYPANFVIIDTDDQAEMIQKVYTDMGMTLKQMPIKRAVDHIGKEKASGEYIDTIEQLNNKRLEELCQNAAETLDSIYYRYLYEQKKNFALDFDDIIIFAEHILSHYPKILAKWQERLQYVMVDEFQDVSPRQYGIAQLLAGAHHNLFIVGDPDQTIYSWRGADVRLFLDFDKEYPDALTVVLTDNYRCTPQILAASNELITKNTERYPKALRPTAPDGAKPAMYHARNERDESARIVREMKKLLKAGHTGREIAVLYRAHHLSRTLEDALVKNDIPYIIYSGTAFYARREVKDVLAYLRMLVGADDMAFMRTVNQPSRKIGRKKLAVIRSHADECGMSMYEALVDLADKPVLARTGAKAYIRAIEEGRKLVGTMPLGDIMQRMLDLSGYEEMLRNLSEWERLDNLAELKRAIEEEGHDDDTTLDSFLSRAALIANIDRSDKNDDAVRLMTVHSAKGMEFDTVFILGLSEGNMPSRRSSGPEDIEEERRLAYVALTRARKNLFISDSEGFNNDNTSRTPSRFIYEMGLPNLTIEGKLPPQTPAAPKMAGAMEQAKFKAGDKVGHPVFGIGTVEAVDTVKLTYTVRFAAVAGARTMRFVAPLEPVQ